MQKFKDACKLSDGKAFGMRLATEYLELGKNKAFEAVSVDGGKDKDIDLFFADDESEHLVIGQLKFNAKRRYRGRRMNSWGFSTRRIGRKIWKESSMKDERNS